MKYKVILLLSIIIHASPYTCRYFPYTEFTICEPGNYCTMRNADLKEKIQKTQSFLPFIKSKDQAEFFLHLIEEAEPGETSLTPGQSFVIKYVEPLNPPHAEK
jgi:hypothetical protein